MLGAGPDSTGYGEEQLFESMCRWFGARIRYADGPPVIHRPDASRLTASRLVAEGARKGRSEAYIARHWLGESHRWMRLRAPVRAWRARRAMRRVGVDLDARALRAAEAALMAEFTRAFAEFREQAPRYLPRPSPVQDHRTE
jgi:hypothetical protein